MRRIHKGPEPSCLADCRRELIREERDTAKAPTSKDWEQLGACIGPVRDALVRDQGRLCAYCGRRLVVPPSDQRDQRGRDRREDMKVEHFIARSVEPRCMFDWHNLLGVCSGRWVIAGRMTETCDQARGNQPLPPATCRCGRHIPRPQAPGSRPHALTPASSPTAIARHPT